MTILSNKGQSTFRGPQISSNMDTYELVMGWFENTGHSTEYAGQPVELLSLIRARYGPLLADSLLSVTLSRDAMEPEVWELRVTNMDGKGDTTPLLLKQSELPWALASLIDSCDKYHNAKVYGLFNEHALSLMERQVKLEEWAREDGFVEAEAVSDFYLRCARELSDHVAAETDLVAETIALLNKTPATGFFDGTDEAGLTRWEEVESEFSGGDSILSGLWRDEVSNAATEAFRKQPFAVQLACWMTHSQTRDYIDEYKYETPPGKDEEIRLPDTHFITESVVESVIGAAMVSSLHSPER